MGHSEGSEWVSHATRATEMHSAFLHGFYNQSTQWECVLQKLSLWFLLTIRDGQNLNCACLIFQGRSPHVRQFRSEHLPQFLVIFATPFSSCILHMTLSLSLC